MPSSKIKFLRCTRTCTERAIEGPEGGRARVGKPFLLKPHENHTTSSIVKKNAAETPSHLYRNTLEDATAISLDNRKTPFYHSMSSIKVHSNLPINPFLSFEFTTPPIPKAGTILHILAAALMPQFFFTILHLSPQLTPCPRLYRSRPKRCIGVLKI